jgi:hypothetical protein
MSLLSSSVGRSVGRLVDKNSVPLAARESTARVYLPILFGSNALYVLLLIRRGFPHRSFWGVGSMLLTWGLQGYSYWGILEHAAANQTTKKRGGELVGGGNLDLLALTIAVQYLTVLWSPRWFWLLVGVPVYAVWSLYQTMTGMAGSVGGGGRQMFGLGGPSSSYPGDREGEDPATAKNEEKREKRAKNSRQRKFG